MKEKLNIVKVGGAVVEDEAALSGLLDAFCKVQGNKLLVTGGGRTATKIAASLGIESKMVGGRRITDAETLKVVTMVYAGLVNKNVVAALQARGVNAIGLSGADMDLIRSNKRPAGEIDYGYVGDPKSVNVDAASTLINAGAVPVVCAITHDGNGQLLNTNADTIASTLASALASAYDVTLTFCFEKKGVLCNPEDEDSVIPTITRDNYGKLLEDGIVSCGMIPKLDNAFASIAAGVKEVVITNSNCLGTDSGTRII